MCKPSPAPSSTSNFFGEIPQNPHCTPHAGQVPDTEGILLSWPQHLQHAGSTWGLSHIHCKPPSLQQLPFSSRSYSISQLTPGTQPAPLQPPGSLLQLPSSEPLLSSLSCSSSELCSRPALGGVGSPACIPLQSPPAPSTSLPPVFFFPSQLPAALGGRGECQTLASQTAEQF